MKSTNLCVVQYIQVFTFPEAQVLVGAGIIVVESHEDLGICVWCFIGNLWYWSDGVLRYYSSTRGIREYWIRKYFQVRSVPWTLYSILLLGSQTITHLEENYESRVLEESTAPVDQSAFETIKSTAPDLFNFFCLILISMFSLNH